MHFRAYFSYLGIDSLSCMLLPFRLKVVVSEEAVVVEPGAVVGATPQIHVQPESE